MYFPSDAINKFYQDIETYKLAILKDKLKEHGISLDYEKEAKKRFKSITVDVQNPMTFGKRIETYYYNDGSDNGLRIVTFEIGRDEPLGIDDKPEFSIPFKYY